tara:strand:- start:148 stop:459 length:312 start_codon:yes stop_codon:yes gene_type:complete
MIEGHDEFKDIYQDLDARINEITVKLQSLPIEDYKIIERYTGLDKEMNDVIEWYENKRNEIILFCNKYDFEKKLMGVKLSRMEDTLQILDNDVEQIKLQKSTM